MTLQHRNWFTAGGFMTKRWRDFDYAWSRIGLQSRIFARSGLFAPSSVKSHQNRKNIALLCFDPFIAKENIWTCDEYKCRVKHTSGCTKLRSYINANNKLKIEARLKRKMEVPKRLFQSLSYPRKTTSVHGWLECVILCIQPFLFSEIVVIRRHIRHENICCNTIMLYMRKLMILVEERIYKVLLGKIEVLFDE